MSPSPDDTPKQLFTQPEMFSSIWVTPDEDVAQAVISCLFDHKEKFAMLNFEQGYTFALTKTGEIILEENGLA